MATLISFPMARSLGQDVETPSPEWITRFVDDIPTGVAVFDRDLNYVAANPAWLDAFGLGIRPLEGQRHDALDPVSGAAACRYRPLPVPLRIMTRVDATGRAARLALGKARRGSTHAARYCVTKIHFSVTFSSRAMGVLSLQVLCWTSNLVAVSLRTLK